MSIISDHFDSYAPVDYYDDPYDDWEDYEPHYYHHPHHHHYHRTVYYCHSCGKPYSNDSDYDGDIRNRDRDYWDGDIQ